MERGGGVARPARRRDRRARRRGGDLRRSSRRRAARSGVRSPHRASRRARSSLGARARVRHAAPARASRRAISTRACAAASSASTPTCSTCSDSARRSCCSWRACRRTRRSRRPSSWRSGVTALARASSRTPCFAASIASARRSTLPRSADPIDALALEGSHPALARRALGRALGHRRNASVCSRRTTARRRSSRVRITSVREQLEAMLEAAGVHVDEAPLARDSIVLSSPVSSLTELGPFRQGLFHLQDPASTLVTQYACVPTGADRRRCLRRAGRKVRRAVAQRVGACSRAICSLSRLAARASRTRSVSRSRRCTRTSPTRACRRFGRSTLVLVDAPCTGTGTFRRHPDARWRLKVSDLAVMAALQRSILRAAAEVVKPGGLLVYSTCSLEPEENDEQIERFLARTSRLASRSAAGGRRARRRCSTTGCLRVLPQRHGTDGAFAARLRRGAE